MYWSYVFLALTLRYDDMCKFSFLSVPRNPVWYLFLHHLLLCSQTIEWDMSTRYVGPLLCHILVQWNLSIETAEVLLKAINFTTERTQPLQNHLYYSLFHERPPVLRDHIIMVLNIMPTHWKTYILHWEEILRARRFNSLQGINGFDMLPWTLLK